MIYRIENFFRKLRRRYSRSEWAIRRLKLPISQDTSPDPGILLIQIDGLARVQLEAAMARGNMPFLRRLMKREHYDLNTFYSGLPSSTPAVQGELHYGKCCAVPAFSYLDRTARKTAVMFNPDCAKKIEAQLAQGNEPLLKGGSSWSNIYTGGAAPEECHFCAASIGLGDMFRSGSVLGFLSIVALQFPAVLRIAFLLFAEFFIALYDVCRGVYEGENPIKEIKFILARVFIAVGLREVISVGAKIDLARGLPIIHVNFLGYDEQSHRRGPSSAFAHWSLKGIDDTIRGLYKAAHRSTRRDYQVWIFSDHGQETVECFPDQFEGGVEEIVRKGLEHVARISLPIQAVRSPARPLSRASWSGTKRARKTITANEETLATETENPFQVAAMGPVGHAYLPEGIRLDQKQELARWLVTVGRVPGVLMADGKGKALWYHKDGLSILPEDGAAMLPHPEALKNEVIQDLICLCQQEDSGDLVLLGWQKEGPLWSFALEKGAHAGPGLKETQGFALLPTKTRVPLEGKDFMRPGELRLAALTVLGRNKISAAKVPKETLLKNKIRILTYNIHGCLGMDGRISPQRIARVLQLYNADVIALQEVDLGRSRSGGHDQAKMIADDLGMFMQFCPTVIRGDEQYGHAVLSRFPVEVVQYGLLPSGPGEKTREPRGAIWVIIRDGSVPLHLVTTHLGLGIRERAAQMNELLGGKWLGRIPADEPILFCGDFNMLPDTLPYRVVTERLRDVQKELKNFKPIKTFAALAPISRIDHIFLSDHFTVSKVQVPRNSMTRVASDHLPLISDIVYHARTVEHPIPERRDAA
ncbi:MAG: Endonuclease/exonuclease/phosphatase [Verrucomicrobiales bacterium]|nr:Endonuclease/exonuclease/phosphatase [Verrucomicrobiales bacterium]